MKKYSSSFRDEQIALEAYYLWLKAGRPAGRDQEFWFDAEKTLQRIKRKQTTVMSGHPPQVLSNLPPDRLRLRIVSSPQQSPPSQP
jgi:hypothetical protein